MIFFSDEDFWSNLVAMTARRAEQTREGTPDAYYLKYMVNEQ